MNSARRALALQNVSAGAGSTEAAAASGSNEIRSTPMPALTPKDTNRVPRGPAATPTRSAAALSSTPIGSAS